MIEYNVVWYPKICCTSKQFHLEQRNTEAIAVCRATAWRLTEGVRYRHQGCRILSGVVSHRCQPRWHYPSFLPKRIIIGQLLIKPTTSALSHSRVSCQRITWQCHGPSFYNLQRTHSTTSSPTTWPPLKPPPHTRYATQIMRSSPFIVYLLELDIPNGSNACVVTTSILGVWILIIELVCE